MHFASRNLPGALLAMTLLAATPAPAATITVDTLKDRIDPRVCSLRAAVESAHTDRSVGGCKSGAAGGDNIRFRWDLAGAIGLEHPLYIKSDLSIEGPGADRLAISGAVVNIETAGASRVDLNKLEMRTGLFIRGVRTVNVQSVRFKAIRSQMSHASAIQVQGSLLGPVDTVTIRDSSFVGNEGSDSPVAVVGETNRLVVQNVDFQANRGNLAGAILIDGAGPIEVDIADSNFGRNQALNGFAGAVAVFDEARLELSRNRFYYNRAQEAGALFVVADSLRVENSAFYRNGGSLAGAIHITHLTGASGESQLLFSTLVDNDWNSWGPAIVNDAPVPLFMGGNLMRQNNGWVCQSHGLDSIGYNLEINSGTCPLYGPGDIDNLHMTLYFASPGPGSPITPAPDPSNYFAVDSIPLYACNDLYGDPVTDDTFSRARPVEYQTGQPGYACDVGAIELRSTDTLYPMP